MTIEYPNYPIIYLLTQPRGNCVNVQGLRNLSFKFSPPKLNALILIELRRPWCEKHTHGCILLIHNLNMYTLKYYLYFLELKLLNNQNFICPWVSLIFSAAFQDKYMIFFAKFSKTNEHSANDLLNLQKISINLKWKFSYFFLLLIISYIFLSLS